MQLTETRLSVHQSRGACRLVASAVLAISVSSRAWGDNPTNVPEAPGANHIESSSARRKSSEQRLWFTHPWLGKHTGAIAQFKRSTRDHANVHVTLITPSANDPRYSSLPPGGQYTHGTQRWTLSNPSDGEIAAIATEVIVGGGAVDYSHKQGVTYGKNDLPQQVCIYQPTATSMRFVLDPSYLTAQGAGAEAGKQVKVQVNGGGPGNARHETVVPMRRAEDLSSWVLDLDEQTCELDPASLPGRDYCFQATYADPSRDRRIVDPFANGARALGRIEKIGGALGPYCSVFIKKPPVNRRIGFENTFGAILEGNPLLLTADDPAVPAAHRGTLEGVAEGSLLRRASRDHQAIELLPAQFFGHTLEGKQPSELKHWGELGLAGLWGYWTQFPCAPAPDLTANPQRPELAMASMASFVARAHALKVPVIGDMVITHGWEVMGDAVDPEGSWFWGRVEGRPTQFRNPTGLGRVVAVENPVARKLVVDATRGFLEMTGVDGCRWDLLGGVYPEFAAQLSTTLLPEWKHFAEDWAGGEALFKTTFEEDRADDPSTGPLHYIRSLEHAFDGSHGGHLVNWSDLYQGHAQRFMRFAPGGSVNAKWLARLWAGDRFPSGGACNYLANHDNYPALDIAAAEFAGEPNAASEKLGPNEVARIKRRSLAMQAFTLAGPTDVLELAGDRELRTNRGVRDTYNRPDLHRVDYAGAAAKHPEADKLIGGVLQHLRPRFYYGDRAPEEGKDFFIRSARMLDPRYNSELDRVIVVELLARPEVRRNSRDKLIVILNMAADPNAWARVDLGESCYVVGDLDRVSKGKKGDTVFNIDGLEIPPEERLDGEPSVPVRSTHQYDSPPDNVVFLLTEASIREMLTQERVRTLARAADRRVKEEHRPH